MSIERDELAELILRNFHPCATGGSSWRLNPDKAAVDILAAGYRKPRTITTAEELDALPVDSVVRDDEMVWLRGNSEWYTPMTTAGYASMHINLPATVLWEPK